MNAETELETPTKIGLWGLILIFALLFSALALNRHAAFQTNGFDLGNVNQALWNTARGRPLAFTNMAPVENRLALHVEPVLFLLVPLYWLGLGGPHLLLIVQAAVVALGAWPLYLIARPKLGSLGGLIAGAAYLLYPALEAAVLYDFHAVTLAPTLLLFAFYWLERALAAPRYWRQFALFAILAMACKEDVGATVAMLGLYLGLSQRRWRPGLLIFMAGTIWSLIAVLGVQALFGGNVQGGRYDWLAEAIRQPALLWIHLDQNVNIFSYLWGLLAPVGGLSLLSPWTLLPILPSLVINLLSSHGLQWRLEEFHYAAPIAPFIFIAAVQGAAKLAAWLSRWRPHLSAGAISNGLLILLLAASLSYHYFRGFSPLARPFHWRPVTAHHQTGQQMAATIDPALPLFAPLTLNPHVSSRQVLHQDFAAITPTDWLWLDVAALPNQNNIQLFVRDSILPNYRVVQAGDGYLLLAPNAGTNESTTGLPDAFYDFARQPTQPQVPLTIFFGDALELIGYDLLLNRAEQPQVQTYWHVHAPLPAGLTPALFLQDGQGNLKGASDPQQLPATLIWYPPERWQLGEVISIRFEALNFFTREEDAFRYALGVSTSVDPFEVAARWPPVVPQSDYAHRLAAEGTLLEIAEFRNVAGMPEGGPPPRTMTAPVVQQRSSANFADQIALVGYNESQVSHDVISLTLIWQALSEDQADLIRFVHVVGGGSLQAQLDSRPVAGTYPTHYWQVGEYIIDQVTIPLASPLPPDTVLHVGFYDPATGQRLLTNLPTVDYVQIDLAPSLP